MELNERFIRDLKRGRIVDKDNFIRFFGDKVFIKVQPTFDNQQDTVMLSRICCYERGKGYASQVLNFVTTVADRMKVKLRGYPEPFEMLEDNERILSKNELIRWYKRNGFRWKYTNGIQDYLLRIPR